MNRITNEVLFYGGIIIIAISLLFFCIYICVAKVKNIKIQMELKEEYGQTDDVKKGKK